jgi:metallo-beta-lactamase class B
VIVDRTIGDGDSLHLGDVTMTAHITPGHTPGCTTWTTTATEDNRNYRVVFHCGTRVVTKLIGNELYPETASDYRRTFERMRELSADVFLAEHPRFFGMAAKIKRKRSGEVNPFIDSTELGRYVNRSEQEFRAALTAEQIAEGHQDY